MGIMEIVIIIILNSSILIVGLVIPFYVVLRSGNWLRGIFLSWGLLFLSFFIVSVPLFGIVAAYNKDLAVRCFPEAIGNTPVLLLGWFPALIISAAAAAIRFLIRYFCPSLLPDKKKKRA